MAEGYRYGALTPEQARKALAEMPPGGKGLGDTLDAGLKKATGTLTPVVSPTYGAGATHRPPSLIPPDMAERVRGTSAPPVTALVAPPTPGALAQPSPVPAATPARPTLMGAANYPNDNSISNLGDRAVAQDLANRTQGALLAPQGYQPISAAGSGGTMVRTQGTTTDYQTPKGSMTFQGGAMGVPGRQGGGTFSVLSGRTAEEQKGIDDRVASINRQTEALRGLRNANRLAEGGVTVKQEEQTNALRQTMGSLAPMPDMGNLDEQQATLMQQLQDAQRIKGFGKRRQREDAIQAAQIGLNQIGSQRQAMVQQYGQQASLAQSLMQNQSAQSSAQLSAHQKMQEARARLGLDTQKTQQDFALNALKTFQGMGEAQQQQAKADLYNAYKGAVEKGDQATMVKLQPLMDYLYPQKQQNDTLAALLQNTPK